MTTSVESNFKAALPPRKRAKTQEEKEQRRVERILRNRRAAHASREKKRKHVEYLEAYVCALEKNLATMQSNMSTVAALVPPEKQNYKLDSVADLSDLKSKIQSNLSVPSSSSLDADSATYSCGDDNENDDHDSSELRSPSLEPTKVKQEPQSPALLDSKPSTGYFNYMSPVSINSSVNSPIDLTIKQEPHSPSPTRNFSLATFPQSDNLMLYSATSGPELLAQNSAAILLKA